MSFQTRLAAIFLVIVIIGLSLTGMIYRQGKQIENNLNSSMNDKAPLSLQLAQFQRAVVAHERILYACFINRDLTLISESMDLAQLKIQTQWELLKRFHLPATFVNDFEPHLENIYLLGQDLSSAMQTSDFQQITGQVLLGEITDESQEIDELVTYYLQNNHGAIMDSVSENIARIARVPVWLLIFSVGLTVILIFLVWYLRQYFSVVGITKLLHSFPEQNPNPVMGFDFKGNLVYCNPATKKLASKLLGKESDELKLLPQDFKQKIMNLVISGKTLDRWLFEVESRFLEFRIHVLQDKQRVHLYADDITERESAKKNLDYLAYHDMVTGASNRYQLVKDLPQLSEEHNNYFCLIQVQDMAKISALDGQKTVDKLYEIIAARINNKIGKKLQDNINLYRVQEELFCLVTTKLTEEAVNSKLQAVIGSLRQSLIISEKDFHLPCRCSVSRINASDNFDILMSRCETAIQHSATIRQALVFHDEQMSQDLKHRQSIEQGIREALRTNQFSMVYQPQISLESGAMIGVEALIRWEHPELGWVSPVEFIGIAEASGQIVPVGEWVLNTACNFWSQLQQSGRCPDAVLAVNLSPRQFQHREFLSNVRNAITNSKLQTKNLELEITESLLMDNLEQVISIMNDIKSLGIALAIDDFGTGYSSLSYLSQFPVDKLKIDRSFVNEIPGKNQNEGVVQAIINMGHALNLKVIAEGAEEMEQISWLAKHKCDEIQGYYFSKPLTSEQLYEFIDNGVIKSWE